MVSRKSVERMKPKSSPKVKKSPRKSAKASRKSPRKSAKASPKAKKSVRKSARASRKASPKAKKSVRVSRKASPKSQQAVRKTSSRKSRSAQKRPLSDYNLFVQKHIKNLPSDLTQKEKMVEIGKMWRTYGKENRQESEHSSQERSLSRMSGVDLM